VPGPVRRAGAAVRLAALAEVEALAAEGALVDLAVVWAASAGRVKVEGEGKGRRREADAPVREKGKP